MDHKSVTYVLGHLLPISPVRTPPEGEGEFLNPLAHRL